MKRIKLILTTVAATVVMMVAAASPALAEHGWYWTGWWQWTEGSAWWCSSGWVHDENDEWNLEALFCYNTDNGRLWTWP